MFRGDKMKMNERTKNAGIAQALADLIGKNRAQAAELDALARLVQSEIAAGQKREAEQAARLGEALGKLAEEKADAEIEKQGRIKAEERAAEFAAALDVIRGALTGLPSTRWPAVPVRDVADTDQITTDECGASQPSAPFSEAAPGDEPYDPVVAKNNEDGPAGAEQATVSIVVTLPPAEAVALEALAAQADSGGSIDAVAARLIHDGLLRTGWTPAGNDHRPQRE
jgi:hypothetical protein